MRLYRASAQITEELILTMEAASASETSVNFYETIPCFSTNKRGINPDDGGSKYL
jgi:hypothetical protein